MKWISITDELPEDGEKVIIWQNNLSDPECSRHHCAVFYKIKNKKYFEVYPLAFNLSYQSKNKFKNYDLEGDQCQLTHWMSLPSAPKK